MDTEIVTNAEEAVATAEVAATEAATTEAVKPAPRAPMNRGKRRKVCQFCADKIEHIDYKDIKRLSKCVSERSKILPRRVTGTCAKHQRQVTTAVKRARTVALLAYISD